MTTVADLKVGDHDALGQRVLCFYSKKAVTYAVYRVARRVSVQFADETGVEDAQRKALAQLAPLRGQIDGLIDGWRDGSTHSVFGLENAARLRSKATRYDRRVADALVVALEGDLPGAAAFLAQIRQDILDERVAWARFEYLIAAFIMAVAVMFAAWLVALTYPFGGPEAAQSRMWKIGLVLVLLILACGIGAYWAGGTPGEKRTERRRHASPPEPVDDVAGHADAEAVSAADTAPPSPLVPALCLFAVLIIPIFTVFIWPSFSYSETLAGYGTAIDLWRASAAGAVGAFFSIALGIRGRTVLPDLLRTSNVMDAVLRVTIGFIAAAALVALLKAGLIDVRVGSRSFANRDPLMIIIAGFLAGFSERMVPDLLAKAENSITGNAPGTRPAPPPPPPPGPPPPAAGQTGGGGIKPAGGPSGAAGQPGAASTGLREKAPPDPGAAAQGGDNQGHAGPAPPKGE